MISIIVTEFLVIAKFDFETITKPIPTHIKCFWIVALFVIILWTFWKFFYVPKFNSSKQLECSEASDPYVSEEEDSVLQESSMGEQDSESLLKKSCSQSEN